MQYKLQAGGVGASLTTLALLLYWRLQCKSASTEADYITMAIITVIAGSAFGVTVLVADGIGPRKWGFLSTFSITTFLAGIALGIKVW